MFGLIPIARGAVIEQMREGMLVLDPQGRIVDLNPAAEKILNVAAPQARGRSALQALPACPELTALLARPSAAQCAMSVGDAHYELYLSALKGRRDLSLGYLLLLHNVTEQNRAHSRIVEQQRALAILEERDRIARELHDGLGQVLGYVKMQAEAARELLGRGQTIAAAALLAQVAVVVQDAHSDVREYIVGTREGMPADSAFLSALEKYARRFSEIYGITVKLNIPGELRNELFEPVVATQLLRIVQETLTNVRKHPRASSVRVDLAATDAGAQIIVQDDGAGFDPAQLVSPDGRRFGLAFMRERAAEIGGTVHLRSAPGAGTQTIISVPLRKAPNEAALGR
jgi:signal transduction histidine kinase